MDTSVFSKKISDIPVYCDKDLNVFKHGDRVWVVDYFQRKIRQVDVELKDKNIIFKCEWGEEEITPTMTIKVTKNNVEYSIVLAYAK